MTVNLTDDAGGHASHALNFIVRILFFWLSAGIRRDQLTTDLSIAGVVWLHSAVDAQRVDGDSSLAGLPSVSGRVGRTGEDAEVVGAAKAGPPGI